MSADMRIGAKPLPDPGSSAAPPSQAPLQSDRSVVWALSCLVCGFGIAWVSEELKPAGSGIRYQTGQLLVLSVFMAIATFMFFRHIRMVSRWPRTFGLVFFLAWFLGSALAIDGPEYDHKAARQGVDQALDLAIKSAASSGPVDTSALTRLSKATGSAAALETLIKSSMKRAVDLHSEYQLALSQSGIERLVDGQRIQQDKSMAETRAIAAEARQVVQVYRQKNLALFEAVRQQLEAAPLNEDMRRKALAGMQSVMLQNTQASTRSWDLGQEMVDVLARTAEALGASRARWSFKDGTFTFFNKSDAAEFARNSAALQKLEAEQQALQDGLLRQARARLRPVP